MDTVGLGVIGLGAVFQLRHGPELRKIPAVRIEVVADLSDQVAQQTGREYDCRHVTDYRKVLADPTVDAVLICTPPRAPGSSS